MLEKYDQKFSMEDVHSATVRIVNHMNIKGWGLVAVDEGKKTQYLLYDSRQTKGAMKIKNFDKVIEKWVDLVAASAFHKAQIIYFKNCIESDSYSTVKGALDFIETGKMNGDICSVRVGLRRQV
jgi:uncharacterized membrane protein